MLSSGSEPQPWWEQGAGESRGQGDLPLCVTQSDTATLPETPGTAALAGSPWGNGAWAVSGIRMGVDLGSEGIWL